jgi:hypothetical protein
MDTDHFKSLAPRTPARPDTGCDSGVGAGRGALRAEALRQLRWQQREWERVLAAHPTGTPCLVAASQWAGLTDGLELLQQAGEEVPSWLYRRGSLQRITDAAGGTTTGVSVAGLLAAITRVLAWFDSAPGPLGAGVVSEHLWVRADADGAGDDAGARERP